MSEYERLVVMDAVLRRRLDQWRDAAHHAVDMAARFCDLADQALADGDRELALQYSDLALEWAKKL